MAAANVIRELFVALGYKVDPTTKKELREYDRQIRQVKRTMQDVADVAVRVGAALAGAVVAGAAAAGALAREMGQQADSIERGARGLNLTRREYQEWLFVVQRFGGNAREMADAFLQINEASNRALDGSKEMTEAFAGIGIGVEQLRGLNPGQLFELIARHASSAGDRSKALATISRLLGEEASRVLGPALLKGAGALRELREQAHELGLVLDDDALRKARAVQDQWRELAGVARGLRIQIGVRLAPVVERVLKAMTEWLRTNREIILQRVDNAIRALTVAWEQLDMAVRAVGGWDVILFGVAQGAGLLLLIANLGRVQAALGAIKIVGTAVGVVLGAVASAMGIGLAPLVLILAGAVFYAGLFALALQDLWVWWQGGNSLLKENLDALSAQFPLFAALRDLVNALGESFALVHDRLMDYVDAIMNGLRPALGWLNLALGFAIRNFERLRGFMLGMQEGPAEWVRGLASGLRDWNDAQASRTPMLPTRVQEGIADRVQRGVDWTARGMGRAERAMSGGTTINQTNHFVGGRGWEVEEQMSGLLRLAAPTVSGGPR